MLFRFFSWRRRLWISFSVFSLQKCFFNRTEQVYRGDEQASDNKMNVITKKLSRYQKKERVSIPGPNLGIIKNWFYRLILLT